jgi:outer membrane biosynthesis protein TonB
VKPGRFIRPGIAASAIGHLSVLAMVVIFADVHPLGSVTAEPITVDIVTSEEIAPVPNKEEPPQEKPSDAIDPSSKPATPNPAAPKPATPQQQAALTPPKQPAPTPQHPDRQQSQPAAVQPQAQPQATSPSPGYLPPEPDLSVKYHVMLGLPPELPVGPRDAGNAEASQATDLVSSLVTEFRRHLKTCSKLPASISPSDSVKITLRVFLSPDGRLAAEPAVMEGKASLKGLDLKQSAIAAVEACQPYTMLPVDRYGEWKVIDLSFTPQDFSG